MNRLALLAGTSAIALGLSGGHANAASAPTQSFVFGYASGNVDATTNSSTVTATTALSSQINNALTLNASLATNQVYVDGGISTVGGPAQVSSNTLAAQSVGNQFSAASNATFTINPATTPVGGHAVVGTSQLNYSGAGQTATLGSLGNVTGGTEYAQSGSTGTVSFTVQSGVWTVGSGSTVGPFASGSTWTYDSSAGTLTSAGSGPTITVDVSAQNKEFTSAGTYTGSGHTYTAVNSFTNNTSFGEGTGTLGYIPYTAATSGGTGTPGTNNRATFTAAATYGAPVAVNSNTFLASATGNLTTAALQGGLPLGGVATGPASVSVGNVSSGTITTLAPLSVSNVQQNIDPTVPGSGTTRSVLAGAYNTEVSASFTSGGYNGGSASTTANSISARALGNSATLASVIDGSGASTFNGGVAVMNTQNNFGGSGTTLTLGAENLNSAIFVQSANSTGSAGTLTAFNNSNAVLNSNSITSRVGLNDAAQTLAVGTAGSPLLAGSSNASGSGLTTVLPILAGSSATLTAQADYLNVSVQRNVASAANALDGSATTGNAIIGYFGGISSGTATVQANTVSATGVGNSVTLDTVLPWAAGLATSSTTAFQTNEGLNLSGTNVSTQLRISDSATMTSNSSDATWHTVDTGLSGPSASSFTNANLLIGGATPALGNTVSTLVLGNNAAANATIAQAPLSSGQTVTLAVGTLTSTYPALSPAGTSVVFNAPTTVGLVQQNLSLGTLTAEVGGPADSLNNLMQIDANGGLANGTALIGYNGVRATAAGNLGTAAANMSPSAGNILPGGVGVFTVQGNQGGSITALLSTPVTTVVGSSSTTTTTAAVLDINATSITNATAQVNNNSLAALAAGNSAQGNLNIAANTIAQGTDITNAQYDYGSGVPIWANYQVANAQANAGVNITAGTLPPQVVYAGLISALGAGTGLNGGIPGVTHLNVGAGSVANSTVSVQNNSLTTTGIGNEYYGTANGFTSPISASTGTYTSLAVSNVQGNLPTSSTSGNTTVTAANLVSSFVVSTADTQADAINGLVGSSGGTITNSVLAVSGNTVGATARLNNASLTTAGIGATGNLPTTNGQVADVSGSLSTLSPATVSMNSFGPVTLSNNQANVFAPSSATTLSGFGLGNGATALAGVTQMAIGWNTSGSGPTGSTLNVDSNTVSASAEGNRSVLAASLATGPAYAGGIGLNNVQQNVSLTSDSTQTASVVAGAGIASFTAGVNGLDVLTQNSAPTMTAVTNSTISVSGNQVAADATLNRAALSVSAPIASLITGTTIPGSTAVAGAAGANAEAKAAIAVANTQSNTNVNAMAVSGLAGFMATASASDSTVTVNGNSLSATANGNLATASLALPRIDSTAEAFNAQTSNLASVSATTTQGYFTANTTGGSGTSNTPVSVSGNLATAASTVNSYSASLTGLGQTDAATAAQSSLRADLDTSTSTVTVTRNAGNVALANAQSMNGGLSSASVDAISAGINLSAATANSALSVNQNQATAIATGNTATQAVLANGPGAAQNRGGIGLVSAQNVDGATISGSASGVSYTVLTGASVATNSPVNLNGNTVGSGASGNIANQNLTFGPVTVAAGSGNSLATTSTVNSNGVAYGTAVADYGLLNLQRTNASTISASTTATNIGYTGAVSGAPVNLQSNLVYASAFGNSGSMGISAPLSGGSMQSTSMQTNYGTAVNASVNGTSIGASMAAMASSNAPVNVTGNVIRATAVGNSLANSITR